jgi:hypothetical protein
MGYLVKIDQRRWNVLENCLNANKRNKNQLKNSKYSGYTLFSGIFGQVKYFLADIWNM